MATEEKKKFKDTKVGAFINKVAPTIIDLVDDVFPPAKLLQGLFDQQPDIPQDQRLEFERLLKEYDDKERAEYLADVQDARSMQRTALTQEDKFSKRFIYYFATASVALGFTYIFCVTFIAIPAANIRFADTILGVVIGVIITAIYQFFFGSSKSSQDKSSSINAFIEHLKTK